MATRIGGAILWLPIMIVFTVLFITLFTEVSFDVEARDRGYDNDNHMRVDSQGCFVKTTIIDNQTVPVSKFCKSDYGLLGIKTWMNEKDQKTWYGLFDRTNSIPTSDVCKERVLSYDLVKTNETTTLHVKCNE